MTAIDLKNLEQSLKDLAGMRSFCAIDAQALNCAYQAIVALRKGLDLNSNTPASELLTQLAGNLDSTDDSQTTQHTVYRGRVAIGGECVDIDFEAPLNASKEQVDAALVDALAQVASIDIVAIGDYEHERQSTAASPRPRG